jgi:phage shock protein PspC (stress-responsive transcriptional regulator)
MKKALKINLSGQIFHIDEDAFEKLKIYLDTISSHFSNASESKEIITDIEMRIAELFREKMTDMNQVITLTDVDQVIEIMGQPEMIIDEEEVQGKGKVRNQRASRRLYRDPDNAILGGVSAGLGAYFNLDILLIRIIFLVLILVGAGSPILLYLILWIAVPKAETVAEKLEMRGEKVNVSNLEKAVKEEYEDVKENLKRARNSDSFRRTEDFFTRFLRVIGTIVITFFKVILGFIALVLILVGIALLFGTIGFVFFGAHFMPFAHVGTIQHTFPELIQPFVNPDNASAFIIAVMLVILIPILAIIYGLFKALFRFKGKDRMLGMGAFTVWILSLIAVFMLVYYEGRNYQEGEVVTDTKILAPLKSDTLMLSLDPSDLNMMNSEEYLDIDNKWYFSKDLDKLYGDIEINVRKSDDSDYKVRIEKSARGRDNQGAQELASGISYSFEQKGSSLVLDPYYMIEHDGRWRAQQVEVTVYVPVGKYVNINTNAEDFIGWIQNTSDLSSWDIAGKTMIMKEDGLSLN